MKVLLDTNIIIHRETQKIIRDDIGVLFNWIDKLKYEKLIHPFTILEIKKHKDPEIVRSMTIKIGSYNIIKAVPAMDSRLVKALSSVDVTDNDRVDSALLNILYLGISDLFITEDKKIREKAKLVGLENQVFSIEGFLEKVTAENPQLLDYKILSVRRVRFGEVPLDDTFFDSFRSDYVNFNAWFRRKNDEFAYVCIQEGKVLAFLYLKVEDENEKYADITPSFAPSRKLKIGTFKVVLNGFKLGERFVKIVFDNAIKQNVSEIYVTIFRNSIEQDRLIDLLQEYGFFLHGEKSTTSGKEEVYLKKLGFNRKSGNPKISFPFISKSARTFMVSIYPKYHTELFPDSILKTESPADYIENEPYRNAISKVYICRSHFKDLQPGDNIVFYRTGGYYQGVVSTIGVVESIVKDIPDFETFASSCGKRSVFSKDELREHWDYYPNIKPFVVNFLYIYSFPKRINLKRLIELGIIHDSQSVPRGFELISTVQFTKMLRETQTNESFIVD